WQWLSPGLVRCRILATDMVATAGTRVTVRATSVPPCTMAALATSAEAGSALGGWSVPGTGWGPGLLAVSIHRPGVEGAVTARRPEAGGAARKRNGRSPT